MGIRVTAAAALGTSREGVSRRMSRAASRRAEDDGLFRRREALDRSLADELQAAMSCCHDAKKYT